MQRLAGILCQAFAFYAHTVATCAAVLSRMYPTIAQRNSTAVLHRLLMCQRCHSICFRSEHQGHGASTRVGPLKARRIQELPVTIPELATMGPSWAPDGTEVLGSSSSSVFRIDALTGQQLRGYREAGGKLTQGKQEDSQKAASALGKHIMPVHSSNMDHTRVVAAWTCPIRLTPHMPASANAFNVCTCRRELMTLSCEY